MGKLEFIKPGLFTSLQDQGRKTGRHWGLPQGGAMDRWSARRANLKINNAPGLPVLEMTGTGPTLLCHTSGQLALAGAEMAVFKNEINIHPYGIINFKKGDILKFGITKGGFRTYISIKNGFITKKLFESVSPVAGISASMRFKKGEMLYFNDSPALPETNARLKKLTLFPEAPIKMIPGPEYHLLTRAQQTFLTHTRFTIAPNATRMAYPLLPNAPTLKNTFSLLTSPVVPGVVQLTPDGQLIVLMRDAQTTGGYPRVLVVTETGMNQLGQMRGGDTFFFGYESA